MDCNIVEAVPGTIFKVDSCFMGPGKATFFVIKHDDGVSLVDTGSPMTANILPVVLGKIGRDAGSVLNIFITHSHLDHIGGCGTLLAILPNAQVYCHSNVIPLLVDPHETLVPQTKRYGPELHGLFCKCLPCDSSRIHTISDGEVIRDMKVVYSLGHTDDHVFFIHTPSQSLFAGDGMGNFFKELNYSNIILLPPPHPDMDAWKYSMHRLAQISGLKRILPCHYDVVELPDDVTFQKHISNVCTQLNHYTALKGKGLTEEAIASEVKSFVVNLVKSFADGDASKLSTEKIMGYFNVPIIMYGIAN